MGGNLGKTSLKRRGYAANPMKAYDDLPAPLRQWMANAALPWSTKSCRQIWLRCRNRGEPVAQVIERLNRAEAATLMRDTARLQLPQSPIQLHRKES